MALHPFIVSLRKPTILALAVCAVSAACNGSVAMDSAFGGDASDEGSVDPASTSSMSTSSITSGGDESPSTTSDGSADASSDASSGGPVCGNGILEGDELCDDGNLLGADTCTPFCLPAACGDGVRQSEETCDEGPDNGPGAACSAGCKLNVCGDGDRGPGEGCDDGNSDDTDACTSLCVATTCGDGIVRVGVETCDEQGESATCDDDCTPAACGDGHVNHAAGEECDDGNKSSLDNCYPSCKAPTMLVFITSELYSGDLGGLGGADAKCQSLAMNAGITGTFKAWLETESEPATTRLYHSPGRYKRLDGVVVADNFEHLKGGPLHAPLTITETLQDVQDLNLMEPYMEGVAKFHNVYWSWDGSGFQPDEDCQDWTSTWGTGAVSMCEQPKYGACTGTTWYNCSVFRVALLCVQQAWYPEDAMPR